MRVHSYKTGNIAIWNWYSIKAVNSTTVATIKKKGQVVGHGSSDFQKDIVKNKLRFQIELNYIISTRINEIALSLFREKI